MTHRNAKTFVRTLLLGTSIALCLPATAALAAPVLFGGGNITVNGQPFAGGDLPAGAQVEVTGALLQLQLADGSIISAPEGTVFTITEEGDGLAISIESGSVRVSSNGAPVSVTRGGVTITTSGGAYTAFASADGGLDGRVNSGSAIVQTEGETRQFAAGEGYTATQGGIGGTFTPPSPQTTQFAQNTTTYSPADQRDPNGNSSIADDTVDQIGGGDDGDGDGGDGDDGDDGDDDNGLPDPGEDYVDTTPGVSSGTVDVTLGGAAGEHAIAYASHEIGLDVRSGVTVTLGAGGLLESYSAGSDESLSRGTNLVAELGGNALVTIGRWNGGTTSTGYYASPAFTYGGQQGFHYAAGVQSPTPITSGTATYTLVKATSPTFGDGRGAPGTLTGSLGVAFGLVTRVGLDLSVTMPGDTTYTMVTTGGAANPASSQIELSRTNWANGHPTFYGHFAAGGTGVACPAGDCQAAVRGFFAGDVGQAVGLSYQIGTPYPSANAVYGAAIFTGAGGTPEAPGGGTSGRVIGGSVTAPLAAGTYTGTIQGNFAVTASTATLGSSGQLIAHTDTYGASDIGTAGVDDLWGNADVTIGRWTDGTITGALTYTTEASSGELAADVQSIHYAIGAPLLSYRNYGTATYTLASATQPTARDGGRAPGVLTGSMAIGFGPARPKVGFDLLVSMPGDHDYVIATPGGVTDPMQSPFIVNMGVSNAFAYNAIIHGGGSTLQINNGSAYGSACPVIGTCFASIGGVVSGNWASSAAISYRIWQSGYDSKSISGAAAFTTTGPVVPVSGSVSPPFADGNYASVNLNGGGVTVLGAQPAYFGTSGELLAYQVRTNPGSQTTVTVGTASIVELDGNGDVTWMRWTGGTTGGSGNFGGYVGAVIPENGGMHWIVGAPTTSIPANGRADYELVGGTSPTFVDGRSAPGTLSGDMAIVWNGFGSKMGVDLTVDMPGDAIYNILSTGGAADPSTSEIDLNAAVWLGEGGIPVSFTPQGGGTGAGCSSSPCQAVVGAQAFGPNAETMGVGYQIGFSSNAIAGIGVFRLEP